METRIIEALEKDNPWWKARFEIGFKPRDIYQEIKKFMHTRQIISLTGLRRTGKTTIMMKLVQDSLEKFGKNSIIYFSFDEFTEARIMDIINSYCRMLNKDLKKGKYLMLFDEIQKISGWEEQLKRIYDQNENIKIIISGSESLFIRKKSRESLAGRMYEFEIKALSFREYLIFKSIKFDNLLLYKEDILKELNHFLLTNGFPEIINEGKEIIEKYLKNNVIEKIIYRDISQIFSIREPAILEQILSIILKSPGEMINLDNISGELGVSRQTISLYLDYLEKSFLVKKIYNFSKSPRKTQRRLKKYYPTILMPDVIDKQELFGKIFETFIVKELNAEFFWRDAQKNEVDIIKLSGSLILPIEIKTKNIDYGPINLFVKHFKLDKGIVITYDSKENNGKIEAIPFYEYLLSAH